MTIKVVIERVSKPEHTKELESLLIHLRTAGLRQPGYLSGETWVSASDANTYLVISTWKSQVEWWAWENSPERKKRAKTIAPLLEMPEKILIFKQL